MAHRPLETWFRSLPPVTKAFGTTVIFVTTGVYLDLISPHYFSLPVQNYEVI